MDKKIEELLKKFDEKYPLESMINDQLLFNQGNGYLFALLDVAQSEETRNKIIEKGTDICGICLASKLSQLLENI